MLHLVGEAAIAERQETGDDADQSRRNESHRVESEEGEIDGNRLAKIRTHAICS